MSEAKQYLSKLHRKRVQIGNLESQIRRLDEMVHNPVRAVTYDREIVQTSHTGSEGTDKIDELVDMQRRLEMLKTSLMKDIDQIRDEIWSVPNTTHMELLSIVYLEGGTLNDAAESMGMSYGRVRHIHGSALAEFQRVVLDPRKEN